MRASRFYMAVFQSGQRYKKESILDGPSAAVVATNLRFPAGTPHPSESGWERRLGRSGNTTGTANAIYSLPCVRLGSRRQLFLFHGGIGHKKGIREGN